MVDFTKPIAESKNFIVLDKYTKECQANESYQSENDLEQELIQDLQNQGYEYRQDLNNSRLRTHSQNKTVAARQIAEKKTVGHLS